MLKEESIVGWRMDVGLPNGPVLEHSSFVLLSAITPGTSLITGDEYNYLTKGSDFSPKYCSHK